MDRPLHLLCSRMEKDGEHVRKAYRWAVMSPKKCSAMTGQANLSNNTTIRCKNIRLLTKKTYSVRWRVSFLWVYHKQLTLILTSNRGILLGRSNTISRLWWHSLEKAYSPKFIPNPFNCLIYATWWMAKCRNRQKTFCTCPPQFYCETHKQIWWHLLTVRNIVWTTQEHLHSCGKRSDYESVAPEHHWGGSIATDKRSGVTSPSEGLCHVPPLSKRQTDSVDVQVLWEKPETNACGLAPRLSGKSLV